MPDLTSRPYNPDPKHCCEACVFGRGLHAAFCEAGILQALREYFPNGIPFDPPGTKVPGDLFLKRLVEFPNHA